MSPARTSLPWMNWADAPCKPGRMGGARPPTNLPVYTGRSPGMPSLPHRERGSPPRATLISWRSGPLEPAGSPAFHGTGSVPWIGLITLGLGRPLSGRPLRGHAGHWKFGRIREAPGVDAACERQPDEGHPGKGAGQQCMVAALLPAQGSYGPGPANACGGQIVGHMHVRPASVSMFSGNG